LSLVFDFVGRSQELSTESDPRSSEAGSWGKRNLRQTKLKLTQKASVARQKALQKTQPDTTGRLRSNTQTKTGSYVHWPNHRRPLRTRVRTRRARWRCGFRYTKDNPFPHSKPTESRRTEWPICRRADRLRPLSTTRKTLTCAVRTCSGLAPLSRLSWKWRKRSSVKIAERTYEKRAQALHC
jgi:hypothetical protein